MARASARTGRTATFPVVRTGRTVTSRVDRTVTFRVGRMATFPVVRMAISPAGRITWGRGGWGAAHPGRASHVVLAVLAALALEVSFGALPTNRPTDRPTHRPTHPPVRLIK